MARTDLLLVLVTITLGCVDGSKRVLVSSNDELGPPISAAEFAVALANPSLRNPPPAREDAIEHSGLFQGDIALTPEQLEQVQKSRSATRGATWENGVIPYTISSVFTSAERQIIAAAMAEYAARTCLSFVGRTSQTDYINIISSSGCWSYVGPIGGRQDLSLKQGGCVYFGIAIHEFMHAAGFWHEQSRYDRDNYVSINWQNIQSGTSNNFDKQSTSTTQDLGLQYDYTSVMHYSAYAFSANGQPTITSKKAGQTLGQRDGFSELDVQGLNLLYECGDSGCNNKNQRCDSWASSGYCKDERFQHFMEANCRKSCGLCNDSRCNNKNQRCDSWASSGYCKDERYQNFMEANCRKSCGLCNECTDNNASCEDWASTGWCEKSPDYMLTECQKSCDSCDGVKPTTEEPKVTTAPPNKCKAMKKCSKKGGVCQPKTSTCDGKINKKGCSRKAGCVCCIAGTVTNCEDKHENCTFWKDEGNCEKKKYKQYMKKNCPKSCIKC